MCHVSREEMFAKLRRANLGLFNLRNENEAGWAGHHKIRKPFPGNIQDAAKVNIH